MGGCLAGGGGSAGGCGSRKQQSPGGWGRGDRGMSSPCEVWGSSGDSRCHGGRARSGGDGPRGTARHSLLCLPFACFVRRGRESSWGEQRLLSCVLRSRLHFGVWLASSGACAIKEDFKRKRLKV